MVTRLSVFVATFCRPNSCSTGCNVALFAISYYRKNTCFFVPNLRIFATCYGRSHELKRASHPSLAYHRFVRHIPASD